MALSSYLEGGEVQENALLGDLLPNRPQGTDGSSEVQLHTGSRPDAFSGFLRQFGSGEEEEDETTKGPIPTEALDPITAPQQFPI
jgi:hypothetical protein